MAIPDFQSVIRPVLLSIQDGQPKAMARVLEEVCDHFQLTDEERAQRLPSGKQTYIKNRVGWARSYMKKAGLLTIPQRGQIRITDRGRQAIEKCPERLTVRYLKKYPEVLAFHTHTPTQPKAELADTDVSDPPGRAASAGPYLADGLPGRRTTGHHHRGHAGLL